VSGGLVPDVHGVPHRGGRVHLRYSPGAARPPHPPGRGSREMTDLTPGQTGNSAAPRGSTLPHFVNQKPFDPYDVERLNPALEKIYMASQWRMMWLRFRRHKVAIFCGVLLLAMYASILAVEFLAPYSQHNRNVDYIYTP